MQTRTGIQKQNEKLNAGKNKPIQNTVPVKKPIVRTTELSKMLQLVKSDPDSISKDEFTLLQSAIGYQQAVKLIEEAKWQKKLEKEQKPEKGTASEVQAKEPEGSKPAAEAEEKPVPAVQEEASREEAAPDLKEQLEAVNKEESAEAPEAKNTIAPKETENKAEESKPIAEVNSGEQQSAPSTEGIQALTEEKAEKKEAAKPKVIKIKGEDPGQILEQLGNLQPTEIVNAYSQAADVSKGALEKQRSKAQEAIPQIPAPTGLEAAKGAARKAASSIKPIEHNELAGFKSEKSGGKAYDNMPGDISTRAEADPDEIMAEARELSAQAPKISMTGEADPSQAESFKAEAAQNVQAAKKAELSQASKDFGENNIYPQPSKAVLKAGKGIQAAAPPAVQMMKDITVSDDIAAQLNKSLAPELHNQMKGQKSEYQKGKEKYDADVTTAKADTNSQIQQQKNEAKEKQLAEQAGAKAEVAQLREQWKEEINNEVKEYDNQAGTASEGKKREIGSIKTQKEREVKNELTNAEKEAGKEANEAKKKAASKKEEGEKQKGGILGWIKEKAQQFLEGIKKAINIIFDGLRKAVKFIFDKAKQAAKTIIEVGRKLIVNLIKELGKFLKGLVKKIFAKFPAIAQKICSRIDKAVNSATQKINNIADTLQKGITKALDMLATAVDKALGLVQSLYNIVFGTIGDLLAGKYKEVIERIGALGQSAKESITHLEGKVWEQLLGVDISKPMEGDTVEELTAAGNEAEGVNEKLTENDIEVEAVENGELEPELLESLNLKEGEVKQIQGSNNPYTMDNLIDEFDTGKDTTKGGTEKSITEKAADGLKTRAENGAKVLDQIKEFVIKWIKDNWLKVLAGIVGVLAAVVAAEIITGGAITAALPTIISIITNLMNATAVISIADTIAKAAGYIATYLTEGWAKNIPVAAIALATAIAMGLVELVMALGFKGLGKGLKKAGTAVKQGVKTAAKGTSTAIKAAAKGSKSLLKSGAKLISRTGSMLIRNGKLVIKGLQKGFANGIKKLSNLIGKLLEKYRFKSFELEREGDFVVLYGIINPRLKLAKWKYKGKQLKIKNADDTAKALSKQELETVEAVSDSVRDIERSTKEVSKITKAAGKSSDGIVERVRKTGVGKTGEGIPLDQVKPEVLKDIYPDDTGAYGYLPKKETRYADFDFTDVEKVNQNRAFREEYLEQSKKIQEEINRMMQQGTPKKEIARKVVDMRNQDKIAARAKMTPEEVAKLEAENMKIYENPVGPDAKWLFDKNKAKLEKQGLSPTDEEVWDLVIEGSMRKDDVINTLLGLKH